MKYISTRSTDSNETHGFEQVVLQGLSPDGGLFIPQQLPQLTSEQLSILKEKSHNFNDLAFELLSYFIPTSEIDSVSLKSIIKKSFTSFTHEKVTPLVKVGEIDILELFHGPTFAFKDVALQFLGNLFEFFLAKKENFKLTVVGATSGDTGSAAIYGLRNKPNINVFILHPYNKVSKIQEAQMTSVLDKNVYNLAIDGTFDNCQDIVKGLFLDQELNQQLNLGAVNSINFARILAQTIYYFYSYFEHQRNHPDSTNTINYSVPTGNFGDILAGYYAKQMGLPINKLIIATNKNDILYRTYETGIYDKSNQVQPSLSPAMDILISSNFERLIYHLTLKLEKDSVKTGEKMKSWMTEFKDSHKIQFSKEFMQLLKQDFLAFRVDDEEIVETIKECYQTNKYLLDPHTAVGYKAANYYFKQDNLPIITLATAHPAKFENAIKLAISNFESFDQIMFHGYLPQPFYNWMQKDFAKNVNRLEQPDSKKVKEFILQKLKE
ncbi:tryptophan synthase beta subunit-like PLP-dependent enzyme [Neoconidiobolus thromboides FSU 785]|nr:tryptophan synthase beta subunit-like PLP-dependent enzyme [Neoconidiobolus thromboides FSU 785]